MKRIDFLFSAPAFLLSFGLVFGIICGAFSLQVFNFHLPFSFVVFAMAALLFSYKYSKISTAAAAVLLGLIFQNSWKTYMDYGENFFADGDTVKMSVDFYSAPNFRSERRTVQAATISETDYRIRLIFGEDSAQNPIISGERAKIIGVFRPFAAKNAVPPWEFDDIFQAKIRNTVGELEVLSIEKEEKMPAIADIFRFIDAHFSHSEYYSLYISLFTGDRSFLTQHVRSFFRESGLIHFLAISGLHIAILILAFSFIAWFLPLPWLARRCAVMALILFLPFLVGFSPPTLRAVIMGTLLTVSPIFNRKNNAINSLFVAAFIILSLYPMHLFLVGFQYSVSATFAVLILPSLIGERKHKNEIMFLAMPVFLFLATAPVQIFHFATITTSSVVSNIIMLPVLTLTCQIALVSVFLSAAAANFAFLSFLPIEAVSSFLISACDKALSAVFFSVNRFILLADLYEKPTTISPFVFVAATLTVVFFAKFGKLRGALYSVYTALVFLTAFMLFDLFKTSAVYTVSSPNLRIKVYSSPQPVAVILGENQSENYYDPVFLRWLHTRLSPSFFVANTRAVVISDGYYVPPGVFDGYEHIILPNATGEISFDVENDVKTEPFTRQEGRRRRGAAPFRRIFTRRAL